MHLGGLARAARQHCRYARPRRFWRRGRAHPRHGRRRPGSGRRRRRPDAADQIRARQGVAPGAAPDRRDQQGRPAGCAPGRGAQRGLRFVCGPRGERGAARLSDPVRLGARRLGGCRTGRRAARFGAAVRPDRRACAAAREAPFAMLATILDYDPYLGRVLSGRIHSGTARVNMPVKSLGRDGRVVETARLTKLLAFRGLERRPIEMAEAGDIVAVAGLGLTTVADTICAPEIDTPLPADPIDPPTLAMTFAVNDSPLAGREGSKVTSRVIGERLYREAEG